jgi:hypothetical protein
MGVFVDKPTLTLSSPFLHLTREGVLSQTSTLLMPTSSFLAFFFLVFHGGGFVASSSKPLRFWPLCQEAPHPPWFELLSSTLLWYHPSLSLF